MRACVVVLALCAGACSARFSYVPRENAAEKVSGRIAARYDVARGTVRVATMGAAIEPGGARALRVRLAIANASDEPWTLDVRDQTAELYSDSRFGAVVVAP